MMKFTHSLLRERLINRFSRNTILQECLEINLKLLIYIIMYFLGLLAKLDLTYGLSITHTEENNNQFIYYLQNHL